MNYPEYYNHIIIMVIIDDFLQSLIIKITTFVYINTAQALYK